MGEELLELNPPAKEERPKVENLSFSLRKPEKVEKIKVCKTNQKEKKWQEKKQ